MRWNKAYDGTKESLTAKSHRPHSQHPNAHTQEELKWIRNYHRRNPNISVCELYGKLFQEKGYSWMFFATFGLTSLTNVHFSCEQKKSFER